MANRLLVDQKDPISIPAKDRSRVDVEITKTGERRGQRLDLKKGEIRRVTMEAALDWEKKAWCKIRKKTQDKPGMSLNEELAAKRNIKNKAMSPEAVATK
jgi:hypothetical protein